MKVHGITSSQKLPFVKGLALVSFIIRDCFFGKLVSTWRGLVTNRWPPFWQNKKNTFVFYFKEDTISINHNWTNACGIYKMWEHLQSELSKVSWMISDKRVRLTTGTINRELTWKSQTETFLYGWMSVVSRTSKSFRLHDLSRFAYIKVVLPVNSVIVNKLKSFPKKRVVLPALYKSKIFCEDRWTSLPTGSMSRILTVKL